MLYTPMTTEQSQLATARPDWQKIKSDKKDKTRLIPPVATKPMKTTIPSDNWKQIHKIKSPKLRRKQKKIREKRNKILQEIESTEQS